MGRSNIKRYPCNRGTTTTDHTTPGPSGVVIEMVIADSSNSEEKTATLASAIIHEKHIH